MMIDSEIAHDHRSLVLNTEELRDPELAYFKEDLERRDALLRIMVQYNRSLSEIMGYEGEQYKDVQFCIRELVGNINKIRVLREVEEMDLKYHKGELKF